MLARITKQGMSPMKKTTITDDLRALANSDDKSETAQLRELYDEIMTTYNSGITMVKIHEALNSRGFTLSLATFRNTMNRLKVEREGKPKVKAVEAQDVEVEVKPSPDTDLNSTVGERDEMPDIEIPTGKSIDAEGKKYTENAKTKTEATNKMLNKLIKK